MDIASWAVLVALFAISMAILAFTGIAIAAFCQNREISLWPPKVGQRPISSIYGKDPASLNTSLLVPSSTVPGSRESVTPSMSGASGVIRPYQYRDVKMPTKDRLFDSEFSVDQAQDFYQHIALHYDQRNSGKLIRTHRQTADLIRQFQEARPELHVLDLGAGTGVHIASSFINNRAMSWDYVDFSSAMHQQFQSHFSNSALASQITTQLGEIHSVIGDLDEASYDVVILSLVLSSMPRIPDFSQLARLITPGGVIIISDIDPGYAALHPHYAVEVDGTRYALKLNPVNPFQLETKARENGLQPVALFSIADNEVEQGYSFIALYQER